MNQYWGDGHSVLHTDEEKKKMVNKPRNTIIVFLLCLVVGLIAYLYLSKGSQYSFDKDQASYDESNDWLIYNKDGPICIYERATQNVHDFKDCIEEAFSIVDGKYIRIVKSESVPE